MANLTRRGFSRRSLTAALCSVLLWLTPAAIPAAEVQLHRITWDEFQARITPRYKIKMVLPDGSRIEGNPVVVRHDAMDLRVTRTSNKRAHPKGDTVVPRSSISVVEARKPRWAGKLIGTVAPIGIGAGLLAAGLVSSDEQLLYSGIAAGGCTMAFGGIGGFFIGRAIDRRFETLEILPESTRGAKE